MYLIIDIEYEEHTTGIRKNNSEDINFKLRILKQLQDSIEKLKFIFNDLTIKDRMNIIRRDRELQTKKRLSRNASSASQASRNSDRISPGTSNTRNLQICSM